MENTNFLDGYKTTAGLILILLGYLGYGDIISTGQLSQGIDLLTQLLGIIMAAYGSYKAHKKIAGLKVTVGSLQGKLISQI